MVQTLWKQKTFLTGYECEVSCEGKKCYGCSHLGHFRQYSKTKLAQKRRFASSKESFKTKKKQKKKEREEVDFIKKEEVDYVFHINNDASIECMIGGVKVRMIIDSGCKHNLLTDMTWEYLKKNCKVQAYKQVKRHS